MSTITTSKTAPAGSWSADPVHSNVSFEIDYAGTNIFRGGFHEYSAGLRKVEAARDTHLADVDELFGSQFAPEERQQLAELLGRLPLAHTAEACET